MRTTNALAFLSIVIVACSKSGEPTPKPEPMPTADPTATTTTAAATAATVTSGTSTTALDAAGATKSTLATLTTTPPPADGLYVADAVVVEVHHCHCPPGADCKCLPDSVVLTTDAADSAKWDIRTRGVTDPVQLFPKGARLRVLVLVDGAVPYVTGAGPRT